MSTVTGQHEVISDSVMEWANESARFLSQLPHPLAVRIFDSPCKPEEQTSLCAFGPNEPREKKPSRHHS